MRYKKPESVKLSSLSIILPAYNEEKNIAVAVEKAALVAEKIAKNYEIIVVNDGSKDNTAKVVDALAQKNKNIRPIHQENKGYGGALQSGFQAASKDWLFFTDSDLQFEIQELSDFLEYTREYDFIFGYRAKRADKFHRLLIAQMLKVWNKFWLGFPMWIKDIDCAFKLMRRDRFTSIGEIYSTGAMINSEFILKIITRGYRIKQLPVTHLPRVNGSSTGADLKVIWKAVQDTFVLRQLMRESKMEQKSIISFGKLSS